MGLYKSLSGMVRVELTSAGIEDSLERIHSMGIGIFRAVTDGQLCVWFYVRRQDLPRLRRFAERRGEKLIVLETRGLFWFFRRIFRRPVLLAGLGLFLILGFYVPSRVLWIEVEGNVTIPDRLILDAARDSGICFGASRAQVRSEKVKNRLLGAVPNLQWAGVNTYGCRAVITVREREPGREEKAACDVSSIVASRDGVILSAMVTAGTGLCAPGQAVRQGEVLISGFTDCGRVIKAEQAAGEIFAQTNRKLEVCTPSFRQLRMEETGRSTKYALRIGKKRINFYKGSGICGGSCVKIVSEYILTLPGGFQLPVALIWESTAVYRETAVDVPEAELKQTLHGFAQRYLKSQMIAGTVLSQVVSVSTEQETARLTGYFACTEMIGRVRPEKIGDYHEKTD